METLFIQLLEEARSHNPESEAVAMFDKIINAGFAPYVSSKVRDVDCDVRNNVFENYDNPEVVLEIFEALENDDLLGAFKKGLQTSVELGCDITGTLSIEFQKSKSFPDIHNDHELSVYINLADINVAKNATGKMMVVNNAFERTVSSYEVPELGSTSARVYVTDVHHDEENDQVRFDLRGYKYALRAIVHAAFNEGVFTLDYEWDDLG